MAAYYKHITNAYHNVCETCYERMEGKAFQCNSCRGCFCEQHASAHESWELSTNPKFESLVELEPRYKKESHILLPVVSAKLDIYLQTGLATCQLSHVFTNDSQVEREIVYKFPVDPRLVTKSVEIDIDGKKIVTNLEEKNKAQETYDDAIASGHGAYLVGRGESKDVLVLNLGRLKPSSNCTVTTTYLSETKSIKNERSTFTIPTVIGQRYGSGPGNNPVPLGLDILIKWKGGVSNLICKSGGQWIMKRENGEWNYSTTGLIATSDLVFLLDEDSNDNQISVYPERWIRSGDDKIAALVDFSPPVETLDQVEEFIICVDCSGSIIDQQNLL
jgi:hypothetical protein